MFPLLFKIALASATQSNTFFSTELFYVYALETIFKREYCTRESVKIGKKHPQLSKLESFCALSGSSFFYLLGVKKNCHSCPSDRQLDSLLP